MIIADFDASLFLVNLSMNLRKNNVRFDPVIVYEDLYHNGRKVMTAEGIALGEYVVGASNRIYNTVRPIQGNIFNRFTGQHILTSTASINEEIRVGSPHLKTNSLSEYVFARDQRIMLTIKRLIQYGLYLALHENNVEAEEYVFDEHGEYSAEFFNVVAGLLKLLDVNVDIPALSLMHPLTLGSSIVNSVADVSFTDSVICNVANDDQIYRIYEVDFGPSQRTIQIRIAGDYRIREWERSNPKRQLRSFKHHCKYIAAAREKTLSGTVKAIRDDLVTKNIKECMDRIKPINYPTITEIRKETMKSLNVKLQNLINNPDTLKDFKIDFTDIRYLISLKWNSLNARHFMQEPSLVDFNLPNKDNTRLANLHDGSLLTCSKISTTLTRTILDFEDIIGDVYYRVDDDRIELFYEYGDWLKDMHGMQFYGGLTLNDLLTLVATEEFELKDHVNKKAPVVYKPGDVVLMGDFMKANDFELWANYRENNPINRLSCPTIPTEYVRSRMTSVMEIVRCMKAYERRINEVGQNLSNTNKINPKDENSPTVRQHLIDSLNDNLKNINEGQEIISELRSLGALVLFTDLQKY